MASSVDRWVVDTSGRDVVYRIESETVRGADFSSLKADNLMVQGSLVEECDFRNSRIGILSPGVGAPESVYRRCDFTGARLDKVMGGWARFEECTFQDILIKEWNTFADSFVDCTFSGKLRNVQFWGAHPEREFPAGHGRIEAGENEFAGNDFSSCDLDGVAFDHGIDLEAQVLPKGDKYLYLADAAPVLLRVLEDSRAKGLPARSRAFLEVLLETTTARNQPQLLLTKDKWLSPAWEFLREHSPSPAGGADVTGDGGTRRGEE